MKEHSVGKIYFYNKIFSQIIVTFILCGFSSLVFAENQSLAKTVDEYDQALNEAYRQLMKELVPAEKKELREEQRTWIAERNTACQIQSKFKSREDFLAFVSNTPKMAKCVLKHTKQRLEPLRKNLQASFDRRYRSTTQTSYPPYPEVWYRRIGGEQTGSHPLVYKTPDGDYLIIVRTKSWGRDKWGKGLVPSYISNVLYFFSGRSHVALTDEELRKYWVGLPVVKSNWLVTNREGWSVGTTRLDPRQPARCPQGFNSYFFSTKKQSRGPYSPPRPPYEVRKSLLVKLDPPEKIDISHLCTDTGERSFTQYVLSTSAQFYEPLDDDTILAFITGSGGLILRLNHKLESKPGQLGKDMIWIPTDDVESLFQESSDTPYQDVQNTLANRFDLNAK